jgi:hypothetical protein
MFTYLIISISVTILIFLYLLSINFSFNFKFNINKVYNKNTIKNIFHCILLALIIRYILTYDLYYLLSVLLLSLFDIFNDNNLIMLTGDKELASDTSNKGKQKEFITSDHSTIDSNQIEKEKEIIIPKELEDYIKTREDKLKKLDDDVNNAVKAFLDKYEDNCSKRTKNGLQGIKTLMNREKSGFKGFKERFENTGATKEEYVTFLNDLDKIKSSTRDYQSRMMNLVYEDRKSHYSDNRLSLKILDISYKKFTEDFTKNKNLEKIFLAKDNKFRIAQFEHYAEKD